MTDDEDTWPAADVAWQGVFTADEAWSIAHGAHVFVFHDVDGLRSACGDPLAGAHSLSYPQPDADGVGARMFFAQPVTLSAIVHEVTHVALFWARELAGPHTRARGWLADHPEEVAELVGNLAAVLWYSLPAELLDA